MVRTGGSIARPSSIARARPPHTSTLDANGTLATMGEFLKKLLDLIPEATYDLISRMLPGGLVIAAFASSYYPDTYGFSINGSTEPFEVGVFLALSYGAGLVVSTLAHPLYWFTWPVVWIYLVKWTDVSEKLTDNLSKALNTESKALDWKCPLNASAVLDRAHDLIKKEDPLQGLVVTKLSAEVSPVYGLSIASGLFAIANCRYWVLPIVLLGAGIIRSIRLWQRHATILQAVTSKAGRAS